MAKETFKEVAEVFADHYKWECFAERIKPKVMMFDKVISGVKVRLNVYYKTKTIHIQFANNPKLQPSHKKCSEKIMERCFADPYANPFEEKALPVPVKEKSNEKKMVPVLELIEDIKLLREQVHKLNDRVAELEQALCDKSIPPFNV